MRRRLEIDPVRRPWEEIAILDHDERELTESEIKVLLTAFVARRVARLVDSLKREVPQHVAAAIRKLQGRVD